jgi:hypothetical protein
MCSHPQLQRQWQWQWQAAALAAAAAAAVEAVVALAAVAVAAAAAEAGGSIGSICSIGSSGGSSGCSGSGRWQQRQQQQWELRWQRQQRRLPNGQGRQAWPGWGRRCASALPSRLGLCPHSSVFASLPIARMWGTGGSGGIGTKSTMIKGEDIQQSNCWELIRVIAPIQVP